MRRRRDRRDKGLEEQLKRALADYQNLIKRIEREKEELSLRANKDLVEELLPAIDDLERAQRHLQDEGLEMAIVRFKQILGGAGVEELGTGRGDKFDENIHEVIGLKRDGKKGTVAKLLRKGYVWKDGLVLRPAQVEVYKGEK